MNLPKANFFFHLRGVVWVLAAGLLAVTGDYVPAAMAVALAWNHAKKAKF